CDQFPAAEGPLRSVPMLVTPVFRGVPTVYVFQTEEPSRIRRAVTLPRNVQHGYCGSSARVSSQEAAGTNTTPLSAAAVAVRRVASCASTRRFQWSLPERASSE